MASRMCLRDAPRSQRRSLIAPQHLVATTKSWRRPSSQRPTISSVRPTVSKPAAHRVDVRGVEEGDAARRRAIEDGAGGGLVALQAEGHGAEAEAGDGEPGAAEADVAHAVRVPKGSAGSKQGTAGPTPEVV